MEHIKQNKILPAVTLFDASKAVGVAQAIKQGGISVMEITFRTQASVEAIKMITTEMPDMGIGAGTILTMDQLHQAINAGAEFGLAPGFNPTIVKEAINLNFPFIPGVMTPSEIELALELGCKLLKLFPAELVGGVNFLKALEGPFGHTDVKFIPMGGVNLQNMNDYLALKNVLAVGGSWIAPANLIASGNYVGIQKITSETVSSTL